MQTRTDYTILEIYSGKPGCMCGCRGRYYTPSKENMATIKRMSRKVMNDPAVKWDEDNQAYFLETATRYNAVYVSKTVSIHPSL